MGNAHYEAVFGQQQLPGQTDAQGTAMIIPPGHGASFRLFLKDYPTELQVENAQP
jgi:hypothetical protein